MLAGTLLTVLGLAACHGAAPADASAPPGATVVSSTAEPTSTGASTSGATPGSTAAPTSATTAGTSNADTSCLRGTWKVVSGTQSLSYAMLSLQLAYQSGQGSVDFGAGGHGTISETDVRLNGTGRWASYHLISTGSGTFTYTVHGASVAYSAIAAPDTEQIFAGTRQLGTLHIPLLSSAPDTFTCSGKTLVLSSPARHLTLQR